MAMVAKQPQLNKRKKKEKERITLVLKLLNYQSPSPVIIRHSDLVLEKSASLVEPSEFLGASTQI